MATSATPVGDDFFGTSYLGYSPYGDFTANYLANLQQMQSVMSGGISGSGGFGNPGSMRTMGQPGQRAGSGGEGRDYTASSDPAMFGSQMNANNATKQAVARPYGTPPGGFDYKGTNIPPDIQGLRTMLQGYLQQQLGQGGFQQPSYGNLQGSELFNLPNNQYMANAESISNGAIQYLGSMGQPGLSALSGIMQNGGAQALAPLQGALAQLLSGKVPNLDLSSIMGFANQGFAGAQNFAQQAVGSAGDWANKAWGGVNDFANQASNIYQQFLPTALNIAQTGGAPIQQLLSSLGDIRNAGNIDIQHNLANIREQYGKQGLGLGSDVSSALALGATQGEAQLQAQQSALLTNVLQQAAQTQLGGVNALSGIASGYGNLGGLLGQTALGAGNLVTGTQLGAGNLVSNAAGMAGGLATGAQQLNLGAQSTAINAMLGALQPGLNILNAPTQNALQAASVYPQYMNIMGGAFNNAAQTQMGLAGMQQQGDMFTKQMQYQNFVRQTQSLPPALQAALGMATSYPPVVGQGPSTGAMLGSAAIGAGGSILSRILPIIMGAGMFL